MSRVSTIASPDLLTLAVVAERLGYAGRDRDRSVRRLFDRHGVPIIRCGRGVYWVTEALYQELLGRMTTCSRSGNAENTSTSAVRSVSARKRESSQSIL